MTDGEKIQLTASEAHRQKSLELLYDYTKFHIGLYLSLTAGYITASTAKLPDKPFLSLNRYFFWGAVFAFIFAGIAGGIIASSLTQTDARSSQEFLNKEIGPWNEMIRLPGWAWTYIEHTSFWIGLFLALLSFSWA